MAEKLNQPTEGLGKLNDELEQQVVKRTRELNLANEGLRKEITERNQAEERIALLQMITIDIAAVTDLPSALEVVLRRVCEKTGWALGQAWVPRQDGTGLDCCPAWFATAANLEEFRDSSREILISRGSGLPGRVLASRQPVWIRDVTQDSNFPRADAARKSGLKAALAVPILSRDGVIAVLEFFVREPREEDERLVKVIAAVAAQIGLVVERKQAEEEVRRSQQQLRSLASRLESIREEERSRIAREIHDELGQVLTGLKMDLSFLEESWHHKASGNQPPRIESVFGRMENLIDRSIQTIRRIATELRPMILDSLGLPAAIEWQAEEFQQTSGVRCMVSVPDGEVKLDRVRSTALFRILQESLTNISRHAKATRAGVLLRNEDHSIVLEVTDNGIGIPEDKLSRETTFGLLSMKERALMLNGSLDVKSFPGKGTTITARLPIADERNDHQ